MAGSSLLPAVKLRRGARDARFARPARLRARIARCRVWWGNPGWRPPGLPRAIGSDPFRLSGLDARAWGCSAFAGDPHQRQLFFPVANESLRMGGRVSDRTTKMHASASGAAFPARPCHPPAPQPPLARIAAFPPLSPQDPELETHRTGRRRLVYCPTQP